MKNSTSTWKLLVAVIIFGLTGTMGNPLQAQIIINPIILPVLILKIYPTISSTGQPKDQTFCYTNTANKSFYVGATNVTTYQWQYYSSGIIIKLKSEENTEVLPTLGSWYNCTNGTVYSGSTSATLTMLKPSTGWTTSSNKSLRCVLTYSYVDLKVPTNSYTTTTISETARLTVENTPKINTQPVSANVWEGNTNTFTASYSYATALQWQKSNVNISGATTSSYVAKDEGSYRIRLYNTCGYYYSNTATLTQHALTLHPVNVTQCETYPSAITFTAGGLNVTSYQWQKLVGTTWTNVSGATSSTLSLPKPLAGWSEADNAQYRCEMKFPIGTLQSKAAILTINALPVITAQPESQTKDEGESAGFNIQASSKSPMSYQWLLDEVNLTTPSATTPQLELPPVTESEIGTYKCQVTNGCGTRESNVATLAVNVKEWPDGWNVQSYANGNFAIDETNNLIDVHYVDSSTAYIVPDNQEYFFKTENGGKTWIQKTITNYKLRDIFFINADTGWVAAQNIAGSADYILYSHNGGDSWTIKAVSDPVRDLYFVSDQVGYASGDGGAVFKTSNGGVTWSAKLITNTTANLNAIHFYNASIGWAAGSLGRIVSTVDGGTTWVPKTIPNLKELFDINFTDATHGWAAGAYDDAAEVQNSTLLKTDDGGTTWTQVSTHPAVTTINGVQFLDTNHGFIVGSGGTILRTNDAGANWYAQPSGVTQDLNAIHFASYFHGLAVGNIGTVLRTASSGCLFPTVNLFGDKSVCSNQTVLLVADTFAVNEYCTYSWNNGPKTGTQLVAKATLQEELRSVIVTSLCGVKKTDQVTITFNNLPAANAGDNIVQCAGDSVQLYASGGVQYAWDKAQYLNDDSIQNPFAGPPVGTTTFTVTVTDENGCSSTDAVNVTIHQIPTSDIAAPDSMCEGGVAAISYGGNATGAAVYSWTFGGGVVGYVSANKFNVTWGTTGLVKVRLAVKENDCLSDTTNAEIMIYRIPVSNFTMKAAVCDSAYVNISYAGIDSADAEYIWNFDGGTVVSGDSVGPYQISWGTEGTKTVSLEVNENGCSSTVTEKDIVVDYPYEGTRICMVTVDPETGKNMVLWEKAYDEAIRDYLILRETDKSDEYAIIADIPFAQNSVFIDSTSTPKAQQHLYKIQIIDTCGNYSEMSVWHKTMLLQYQPAVEGVTMEWQKYELEVGTIDFESYIIYRGADSTAMDSIITVSGNVFSYNDLSSDATAGKRWYQVAGVKTNACYTSDDTGLKAGTGPYSHSLSNLDDNKLRESSGVNNAPSEITLGGITVPENSPVGILIGRLTTTDVDTADTPTYTLVAGAGDTDNGSFVLQGDSLLSAGVFDYELKNSYTVRVRTTDDGAGNLFFEKSFTIVVLDANETGISNPEVSTLKIYPNPSNQSVNIEFANEDHSSYRMTIYDISGKPILQLNDIRDETVILEKGTLEKGYYLIQLKGEMTYIGRLLIK